MIFVFMKLMEKIFKFLKHPLTWIIFLGFLLRFLGVKNFPVLHDEIISILEGVNKTKISWLHFFYIASLENCLGIMPLYFWIERLFTDILGPNNWGLRIFPLLMGLFTIYLAYYIIKKRFNKDIAILSAFLVAISDIFVWVTSKAQFFEVILVPLSFVVFYFALSENRKKFYYISLAFSLMLFTYFGKGVFLFFSFLLWYFISKLFDLICLKIPLKELILTTKKELLQLLAFFLIPLLWIISAHFLVFSKGPINSAVGLGEVNNIWKMLYLTTFGYGVQTKQFLKGTPRDAFLVFDNIHVWPITSLLFIPFLFGSIFLILELISNWKKKEDFLFKRNSYILTLGLVPFSFILFRGIISERFHLFYFLPFVVICAIGLQQIFLSFSKNKILPFIFIFILATYGAYVSSWQNWYYKVFDWDLFLKIFLIINFAIIFYFIIGFITKISKENLFKILLGTFLLILLVINFFFGPLVWGKIAGWNPAADNKLSPAPGYYVEGNEESVINFALKKRNSNICYKLPQEWEEKCLSNFK